MKGYRLKLHRGDFLMVMRLFIDALCDAVTMGDQVKHWVIDENGTNVTTGAVSWY